jgi:hypothetical protein
MTALQTLALAGGVTVLLVLASTSPADDQVMVNRGINPWTGLPYQNVAVRNPWTGRVGVHSATIDPWTGATVRGGRVINPRTGRVSAGRVAYNPWTGRYRWGVNTRRW